MKRLNRDDCERRPANSGAAVIIVSACLVALLLYPLSSGPAVYLCQDHENSEWLNLVYAPLIWLAERSEHCDKLLLWYIKFWLRDGE